MISSRTAFLVLAALAVGLVAGATDADPALEVFCIRENFVESDCDIADIVISAEIHACAVATDSRLKAVPHHDKRNAERELQLEEVKMATAEKQLRGDGRSRELSNCVESGSNGW
jgi:formaldehyde-activating enzyme involved in methanogenesis